MSETDKLLEISEALSQIARYATQEKKQALKSNLLHYYIEIVKTDY